MTYLSDNDIRNREITCGICGATIYDPTRDAGASPNGLTIQHSIEKGCGRS